MLSRSHLAIIREVNRLGTLTEAASALCLTQSALSHAIRKLEHEAGTPIWQKEGRGLRLTQAGNHLLGLANRLLPQFEHAESVMRHYAEGQRGTLRIGMECHPCYQWLLKVVSPYLNQWPDVDLDIKQEFQFGGLGALLHYDIDLLITPDPLEQKRLCFIPVFHYEQVLVTSNRHPFTSEAFVTAEQLTGETLLTYPVENERLDIFRDFLLPAKCRPKTHKTIETTEILLHLVAAGRGVTALPDWLVAEHARQLPLSAVRMGKTGLPKQLYLGIRESDARTDYLNSFVAMAREVGEYPAPTSKCGADSPSAG